MVIWDKKAWGNITFKSFIEHILPVSIVSEPIIFVLITDRHFEISERIATRIMNLSCLSVKHAPYKWIRPLLTMLSIHELLLLLKELHYSIGSETALTSMPSRVFGACLSYESINFAPDL